MAFLGPELPNCIAREIAEGDMDPMTQQRFDSLTTAVKGSNNKFRHSPDSTDVDALTTAFAELAIQKQRNHSEMVPVESSFLRNVQVGLHLVAMALPLSFYCVVNHVL